MATNILNNLTTPSPVIHDDPAVKPIGGFTRIEGEAYYVIHDYDMLDPFLMSIVSDSDHWMYLASSGGLTAGRGNPDCALFPYDTEDKLYQTHGINGPRTVLWVRLPGHGETRWEPFAQSARDQYHIRRNLYKSELGNAVIFEECNQDLELTFRYGWRFSEAFGFVRKVTVANTGESDTSIRLMDGLLNPLAYGISAATHQSRHCLADAYKHSEVDPETGLGVFMLSSMIVDKPEPGETMYATSVWSQGLDAPIVSVRPEHLKRFRRCRGIVNETLLKGRKSAYLIRSNMTIAPGRQRHWYVIADVAQDHKHIARLHHTLKTGEDLTEAVEKDCRAGGVNLRRNIASADGLQTTGSQTVTAHHFANVLFNNMRGGVFDDHYNIHRTDLARFIRNRNKSTAQRHDAFLAGLDELTPVRRLLGKAGATDDPDLVRLCYEYLPLYFSRRHGDPSRPWNRFDIRVKDADGKRVLAYQGNWRDIFQNWEALCLSFPAFLPSVIAKFVNASTADGFNPYRITSDGIDWELVDEHDPFSHIGYWGDHQIVYLLRLLEALNAFYPDMLGEMMRREVFSYADVPYTIKPYDQLLEHPHDTIEFDHERQRDVNRRVESIGADGRLLTNAEGQVLHVNLAEKLLVPALAKLSNLVLEGGIWLNTQRPEWNDANNALVGDGLSVVTLCYLRRYLAFCRSLFAKVNGSTFQITNEVAQWLDNVLSALNAQQPPEPGELVSDIDRKRMLDQLGAAFCQYRAGLYANGLTGKTEVNLDRIEQLIDQALRHVDHSIRANKRDDGMYHAYNLMDRSASGGGIALQHLYEMLEGQVAVLSSGVLNAEQALQVLDALRRSAMYRPDQDSYMLYPDRTLPGFLAKNNPPAERVEASPLLMKLLEAGDERIIYRDADGRYRFAARLDSAKELSNALDAIAERPDMRPLVEQDAPAVAALYESVFNHKQFTGRSGGMYGYEGLGCIYWHMVAKLLLAAQECHQHAVQAGEPDDVVNRLAKAYHRIRNGLGFNKTPEQYGAFPADAYSHTPSHSGARQPGMTGQVKEMIITRWSELGLIVHDGALRFAPALIPPDEFLKCDAVFNYEAIDGRPKSIQLPTDTIAFTVCQTPVIYHLHAAEPRIIVTTPDAQQTQLPGNTLPPNLAQPLFNRTGEIDRIDVYLRK